MSKGSKRMRESLMRTNDPAVDKNDKVQTEEMPKNAPGTKKVNKWKEKVHEGVGKGETEEEKIRHQTLKLKTSPRKIIEMIQALNEEQMNEVIDMGFGELRHFGIAEVPGKMAYDLVRVDTVLINPCGDGKFRTRIDYVFRDISVVKEYNWCAYVLETLAVAVKNWRSTKNTPFTGPIAILVAFYVDRVFHKKLLVSRVFPTVFGWTSEKLRQREKMELESADTIGRGSLVDRGDPDKLSPASEDAVRGLQNLLISMNDFTNVILNFEAMKIAGSTVCNMIGVIPEVEVDEEETVASLKTALAKDKFNVPELVEAVQRRFKVTAQLTQLAEEGPPFDIHPSFVLKNGDLARRIGVKQGKRTNINELQNCVVTPQAEVNKSVLEISSFTAIGRIQSSDTEKTVISVGFGAARLCASKSEYQVNNPIIGTSFNGGSDASHQTGLEKEGSINVEEIVKSAMADYMEGGGDDVADEFYSEASGTKSIIILDNKLISKDETNDKELDVEAIVQSALEAYMECDEVDEDFVTPFAKKSEPKLGKELVFYTNEQLNDNIQKLKMNVRPKADMRCSNALRSPFLERTVTVSCKLTPDERVMYYWLMTTYHGNE
ncbi:hypothetical protein SASPL_101646 [Salvia splendens]|uniref:Uncharacterized protein n=1 Tax=Salvia splendens TaxID=180675 RepID=A0A8X8YR76_SALSN|nr:hypothetical protein SASPL_101646 [Salvia splendens]